MKLKLLAYLSERIGLEQEIVITGVEEFGFFGQAETLPIEGLVHVSSLMDDDYWFDEASHSLIGRRTKRRFRLGDAVRVKVARVDLAKRQLDFRLAGAPLPPHAEPPMHRHRAERPPPSKPRPKPKRQGQRKPKRKR